MHECPVDHPALPGLFDPTVPDSPVLWAVLTGRHAGRALVDDVNNPTQFVLRTDAVLTFASRRIHQTFLNEAIARFRKKDAVWHVWPPTTTSQLIPPEATSVIQRLEFYDCDSRSRVLADLRGRLQDEMKIRPIDRELLERCEWQSEMEFFCGSLNNFLAHGLGLCMMQGEEIIVEAYASSLGEGKAEIGAITREPYRGLGYAPITCAYLIDVCAQRGYEAIWSCDADNEASIRVARKLDF